jgi:hypothetical protein
MKAVNVALLGSIGLVAGIVYIVHQDQQSERKRMHEGVLRDAERRRQKEEWMKKEQEFCEACDKAKEIQQRNKPAPKPSS